MPLLRGEVYLMKDGGGSDSKPRPIAIVSRSDLNRGYSVTIVPFTTQKFAERCDLEYCVPFYENESGISRNSIAKCDEVTRIPIDMINLKRGPIGTLEPHRLQEIIDAVGWSLGLSIKPAKK